MAEVNFVITATQRDSLSSLVKKWRSMSFCRDFCPADCADELEAAIAAIREAMADEGSDGWVPSMPLRVFSAGQWNYGGCEYDSRDLDEVAFIRYRDVARAGDASDRILREGGRL